MIHMEYYTRPFNFKNSLNLPTVTRDYLLCIGVKEKTCKHNDLNNSNYNNKEEYYPIEVILSRKYDCVAPVWKKLSNDIGGYLLVRKNKYCSIINIDGTECLHIHDSYLTIIPPIDSNEFIVQNKEGKWGVVNPNKGIIVTFGKYKYLWGYDHGLCLFETYLDNKRTFANRGIIDINGDEIIKPYTFTDIFNFYGMNSLTIKVENGNEFLFLDKNDVSRVIRKVPYYLERTK